MNGTSLPIRHWVICVAGFTQHAGQPNGMSKLWRRLHDHAAAPDVRIELRRWCDDVDSLAEQVWLWRPEDRPPRIDVIGYSWGGMTALNFCERLADRELTVANLILCDAVFRHRWWCLRWLAYTPWPVLVVPGNVARCKPFRQHRSLLRGHDVVVADPKATRLEKTHTLASTHRYADDSIPFQMAGLELVA